MLTLYEICLFYCKKNDMINKYTNIPIEIIYDYDNIKTINETLIETLQNWNIHFCNFLFPYRLSINIPVIMHDSQIVKHSVIVVTFLKETVAEIDLVYMYDGFINKINYKK